jgi:hypothetical protein
MTGKRARRLPERQAQIIDCARAVSGLAKHRDIQALRVHDLEHDLEIRAILGAIIRRWKAPASYISAEARGLPRGALEYEHVVPIRLLVDRMIKEPADCEKLLTQVLTTAWVTPPEHQDMRGMFKVPGLYDRMFQAPLVELPELGLDRYRHSGVEFHRIGS